MRKVWFVTAYPYFNGTYIRLAAELWLSVAFLIECSLQQIKVLLYFDQKLPHMMAKVADQSTRSRMLLPVHPREWTSFSGEAG